jgi:ABC-type sugar transport system substrate-binding protein
MKKINLIVTLLIAAGLLLSACQPAAPQPAEAPAEEPAATEAPAVEEPEAPAASEAPAATEAPAVEETETPAEEPAAAEPLKVAFFVPWTEDVWYVAAIEGAKMRAEELGIELDVYDAGYKVETQVQQFDTAMASNPDAIVLSSVDPAAMVPSVERARDAGIVVVDYDRPIWETEKLNALLILDTPGIGTQGCEAIVAQLTEKYGEPKGKVIRAFGDLADTWVTDISQGWDPCMAQYPAIEILSATSGPWEPEQAAANVEQLLVTNPDVDAIFLDSDWLGSGITRVIEAQGFGKQGEENHIYYVGVGGMPQALDYIREGWMDITINNPIPDFAGAAIEVAAMLSRGEELPAEWVKEGAPWSPAKIYLAEPTEDKPYAGPVLDMMNFIVDPSNVEDPTLWGNLVAEE